jgi:hypothetical protein
VYIANAHKKHNLPTHGVTHTRVHTAHCDAAPHTIDHTHMYYHEHNTTQHTTRTNSTHNTHTFNTKHAHVQHTTPQRTHSLTHAHTHAHITPICNILSNTHDATHTCACLDGVRVVECVNVRALYYPTTAYNDIHKGITNVVTW